MAENKESVATRKEAAGTKGDLEEGYLKAEVLPHVADAWIDHSKTKVGYEIPLTRHFYVYQPPRPLEEIAGEISQLERDTCHAERGGVMAYAAYEGYKQSGIYTIGLMPSTGLFVV
jgi:hypothetical protein